ncbi:MAG: RnfABCDGE type electron transport complex subunit G [Deltaproteobacteria bacterium]|nr:RnfABCDGE type electron transport complex subunit G [Deltaproteobacteria bacterium]
MNKVVKMLLVLSITGAVSGGILAQVFHFADPLIQENRQKELRDAIFLVLPEAKDYKTLEKEVNKEKITIYKGIDGEGKSVGVAFIADGGGFQGNIRLIVGLNNDYLKLKAIKVLEQNETPGLDNRIKEPQFEDQFKNLEVKPKVEYIKYRKPEKPNQIQAITGATISSDAVVKNINNAVEKVLKNFPQEEVK